MSPCQRSLALRVVLHLVMKLLPTDLGRAVSSYLFCLNSPVKDWRWWAEGWDLWGLDRGTCPTPESVNSLIAPCSFKKQWSFLLKALGSFFFHIRCFPILDPAPFPQDKEDCSQCLLRHMQKYHKHCNCVGGGKQLSSSFSDFRIGWSGLRQTPRPHRSSIKCAERINEMF